MEKLNVERCGGEPDDGIHHLWKSVPTIEETEIGPIAWWCCSRCPARTLFDHETEDHFAAEPVVVYPLSCFELDACACEGPLGFHAKGDKHCLDGCGCPRKASGEIVHIDGCADHEAALEQQLRAAAPEVFDGGDTDPAPPPEQYWPDARPWPEQRWPDPAPPPEHDFKMREIDLLLDRPEKRWPDPGTTIEQELRPATIFAGHLFAPESTR